jgi:hypothetical protein
MNALCSGLIGIIVECAGVIYAKQTQIDLQDLLKSIGDGIFVGTVALYFLFHVFVKLKKRPFLAFLAVFIVVALLSLIGDIWFGPEHLIRFIHTKWPIVLFVSETLGLLLAFIWYRQIVFYNRKLELKKSAIPRE